MKLKHKLALFALLCSVLPLVGVSTLAFDAARDSLRDLVQAELLAVAQREQSRLQRLLDESVSHLKSWSNLSIMQDVLTDDEEGDAQRELVRLKRSYPVFSELIVLNENGIVVSTTRDTLDRAVMSIAPEFTVPRHGTSYRGAVGADSTPAGEFVTLSEPIRASYDESIVIGVLIGWLDWNRIKTELSQRLLFGGAQSEQRRLVLRSLTDQRVLYASEASPFSEATLAKFPSQPGIAEFAADGSSYLIATARFPDSDALSRSDWVFHVVLATKVAFASIRQLQDYLIVVGALAAAVVTLLGYLLARATAHRVKALVLAAQRLASGDFASALPNPGNDEIGILSASFATMRDAVQTNEEQLIKSKELSEEAARLLSQRVRCLSEGAQRFYRGDLGHRIHLPTKDELGELATTFNMMAETLGDKEVRLQSQIEQLDRANRDLDGLIDSIPDLLLVVDCASSIKRANPAALTLSGYEEAELLGRPLTSVLATTSSETPSSVPLDQNEGIIRTKYGGQVPVSLSAAATHEADSPTSGSIVIAKDITERKSTERQQSMKHAVARLLAGSDEIADVMPNIIQAICEALGCRCGAYWRWDDQDQLLHHAESWGVSTPEVAEFLACQSTNDPKKTGGLIRRAWTNGEYQWISDVAQDSSFWRAPFAREAGICGAFAFPVQDGVETYGVLEFFSADDHQPDEALLQSSYEMGYQIGLFTRRKRTEAALRDERQRLERSNRELDQFAYVTSHDLKAPLRAIANLAGWIEEDLGEDLSDEVRENIDLLKGRVHRMEGLIQGILEYSRIGREETAPEPVDVAALLHETIDSLPVPPEFRIVVNDNMPVLTAPRVRLTQVFSNLIGNAIKYHDRPDGRVEVSLRNGGAWYEFSVADDGPGIAPQYHEKVFSIFQTLEARDQVESTGIGLTLVKKIVEEQGGNIGIDASENDGACFTFTWPTESTVT